MLAFGDKKSPALYKTGCGGCCSILFCVLSLGYFVQSLLAINSGVKDRLETSVMDAADSGILSLEDMQVMPVVHITMDDPSVYIDTTQEVFSRTIFVGLMYLNRDGDGYEASFEEFTLCSE